MSAPLADRSISEETSSPRRKAWEVYAEAVDVARAVYRVLQPENVKPAELFWPENVVRKIFSLLREGNGEILALATRCVPDHFLFGHVPNLSIFSLRLGLAVGLEEEDAVTLGLAAFLSELGLASHLELASKMTKLTDEEIRLLRTHVEAGVKTLDLFPIPENERKDTLRRVIGQCHERVNGKGYPDGLKGDAIHPFAKLIGMMDAYEAMTHDRPWRARTIPHRVLRGMVEDNQDEFDPLHVRSWVESLSFYPPGTFVRLNTGDIARVESPTTDLPLRPRVWVFMDTKGRRLETSRVVPLGATPSVFIEDAVDETTLTPADPRLAMELRAQRWWVKGL